MKLFKLLPDVLLDLVFTFVTNRDEEHKKVYGNVFYFTRLYPWDQTQYLCNFVLSRAGQLLGWCPKEFLSMDLCLAAVLSHPYSVVNVPHEFQTQELWRCVLSRAGQLLGRCPEKFRPKD